jgi:nitrogen regulatory protein P-II 1
VLVMVTALVKPHQLDDVRQALAAAGATDATLTEVRGFGRQGGHTETYRGAEYRIDLVPKARIDVVCGDDEADAIVEAVLRAAATGRIGDGKIWVTPLEREYLVPTVGDCGTT